MNQTSKLPQTILFGVLIPVGMLAVGFGAFVVMGKQLPKQAAVEGKDTITKLRKLPIVAVGQIESSAALASLDVAVSGTVVPYRQINLAAEIAGLVRIKSDNCQIGRYVNKGDILFELDSTDTELEIERLEALKETELAQQRELDQEISNAKKSLELAEEELALNEKELKRLGSLAKGFASENELDQSRRQRVTSANARLTIQNQLQMMETKRSRLKLAERLAEAQLQQARVNLERTTVASPIDGVIVTESVQADSFVQRGATLCVIEDTQRVEVSCNLRSDQLLLVLEQRLAANNSTGALPVVQGSNYELPNTPVTVSYRVAGREEISYQWKGHLSRYEGVGLDSQSRTVPVRVRVDNPQEAIRNGETAKLQGPGGIAALVRGMFVECQIHTSTPRDTVLIPKLGLKPGNQVWKFVRDDALVASEESDPETAATASDGSKGESGDAKGEAKKATKNLQLSINPDEWTAGRVEVISNVKVLSLIQHGPKREDYWVVEAKEGLTSGDSLIVSPLANIAGDGSDLVRYQSTLPAKVAAGNKE